MLKPPVPKFRSNLSVRLRDIAEKQVPAKQKPIVVDERLTLSTLGLYRNHKLFILVIAVFAAISPRNGENASNIQTAARRDVINVCCGVSGGGVPPWQCGPPAGHGTGHLPPRAVMGGVGGGAITTAIL